VVIKDGPRQQHGTLAGRELDKGCRPRFRKKRQPSRPRRAWRDAVGHQEGSGFTKTKQIFLLNPSKTQVKL
jgi:hypothetical protein